MKITLIGMAGVGKSFIGEALAKELSVRFIDTDRIIEDKYGMKLQDIIDTYGEKEFLEMEKRATLSLKLYRDCIISTGGSIIYSKEAMEFLKKDSVIIFLDASLTAIDSWIANKITRGIVYLKKGLRSVYKERLPLYKKYADIRIKLTKSYDRDHIVKDIILKVKTVTGK